MAKLQCAKSGITFSVEHLPITIPLSTPIYHPFFSLPQKSLISLAGQWAAAKLTETESYLLYLSLLDSTELIKWRAPATYNVRTAAAIASNMESLLHIIAKINLITHPSFTLPSFVISPDTADLGNSSHWITAWTDNYREWYDSYLTSHQREELKEAINHREEALQRLIKSSTPVERYAALLADWAAIAGQFPDFSITHFKSGKSILIGDYWKSIIRAAHDDDRIWEFPRADIVELIEHCEDKIVHGNIYAHTLMRHLRDALKKYDDYCGFGDWTIAGKPTAFTIMRESDGVQETNLAALVQTAPEAEPRKHQYRTTLEWLKAYTKWSVAKQGQGAVK